jgi:ribosomal protein S12 methylthiotransferase
MVGQTVEVLLEGVSGESDLLLEGRTEAQAPEIDGHVLINDCGDLQPRVGEFFRWRLPKAWNTTLSGESSENPIDGD